MPTRRCRNPRKTLNRFSPALDGICWRESPTIGVESATLKRLKASIAGNPRVLLRTAAVTLEHDLARASDGNAEMLVLLYPDAANLFPDIFTLENLRKLQSPEERARFSWQAICRKDGGKHKAALAQVLAGRLSDAATPLTIPAYLAEAFDFMSEHLTPARPSIAPLENEGAAAGR